MSSPPPIRRRAGTGTVVPLWTGTPHPSPMRALLTLLLALGLAACDAAAPDTSLRVALSPGLRTEYAVTSSEETADGALTESTATVTMEVVDTAATLEEAAGFAQATGLTEVSVSAGGETSRVWYHAAADGLAEVAYEGSGASALRRSEALLGSPTLPLPIRRWLGEADTGARRTPVVRSHPRVVLPYPAEAGQTWVHYDFTDIGFPLRSVRTSEGEATVTTPAGTFRCAVLRSTVEFAGVERDVDWVDYVADVGLVRRELVVRNPELDGAGQPTGRTRISTVHQELTAVTR